MKLNDTIAAIATPRGAGGIAIIRISGSDAESISEKMAKPYNGKCLSETESHKLTLCKINAYENPDFMIDEALVAVMRAPKSYTGETVVEINCHGGYLAADKILNGILLCGARLAEAGEFTRRAFINGKTDLSGAEAVIDLMQSATEAGLHNAAISLRGALADKIYNMRERVLELAANVSAAADYPDEVEMPENSELEERIGAIKKDAEKLLESFDTGRIMRDGVRTAIVGRPNVGKSSILNALLKFDRAIVTDVPGTTRDTIEELISVGGVAIRICDTAGIHTSSDKVEQIGIEKSIENIAVADLCLFVLDSSEDICDDDIKIAEELKGKKVVIILNKTDKNQVVLRDEAERQLGISAEAVIETSAPKTGNHIGIDRLEAVISDLFATGAVKSDEVYLSNERQRDSLIKANLALEAAIDGIRSGMPSDLLFVDLEDALSALGEITGETVQEEIVDNVFERFCVGK